MYNKVLCSLTWCMTLTRYSASRALHATIYNGWACYSHVTFKEEKGNDEICIYDEWLVFCWIHYDLCSLEFGLMFMLMYEQIGHMFMHMYVWVGQFGHFKVCKVVYMFTLLFDIFAWNKIHCIIDHTLVDYIITNLMLS